MFFFDVWFSFGVYGCGVKVGLLWGFWWKMKTFLWFHGLVFCLGFSCLNIFLTSVYGVESDGMCAHFESVFPFEWVVGVWVGWFFVDCLLTWIGCFVWCLKVSIFMVGKGVAMNGGQSNEHIWLSCQKFNKGVPSLKHG